jgi:periplasmic divalent cation tolerance protein
MQFFYIPCKDKDEAKTIAMKLLQQKLIFCANIIANAESYLLENEKIESTSEAILILKASKHKADQVRLLVNDAHSYQIPAIISFDADANSEFAKLLP